MKRCVHIRNEGGEIKEFNKQKLIVRPINVETNLTQNYFPEQHIILGDTVYQTLGCYKTIVLRANKNLKIKLDFVIII